MNELLQKHGCSNVFHYPDGLKELMTDISREVLRAQPTGIYEFIANYLSVLLVTREHGILTVKILEDLCDCKPSVAEHLIQLGMNKEEAEVAATIIKEEIEMVQTVEGREKLKEAEILKRLLKRLPLDEEMTAHVCEVARNAFKDFWYRKMLLEQSLKEEPEQTWEIAAQRTLAIYKLTNPSFSELTRATERVQAAYKGYYVRKKMLKHLKPKKKQAPKVDLQGPPVDIAESRKIDLGRVMEVQVKEDDVEKLFADEDSKGLGLNYDPTKTITHVDEAAEDIPQKVESKTSSKSTRESRIKKLEIGGGSTMAASTKFFHDDYDDVSSRKGISFGTYTPNVEVKESIIVEIPEEITVRESRIQKIPEEIAVRESRIQEIPEEITVRESRIQEIPEEIAVRESRIQEIPEEITVRESRIQEIPEEIKDKESSIQEMPDEITPNVTEVIIEPSTDYHMEDDSESVPLTSALSSAPTTAPSTDVEEMGEISSADEAEEN